MYPFARIILQVVTLAALMAAAISGCNLTQPSKVGEQAPHFTLPLLEGGDMDLARHAGRDVVILDFWATWCPPCREGLPGIAELAARYADAPVAVYAVNIGEPSEQVRGFLRQTGIEIPVALDTTREVAALYQVQSIPTTLVIGRDGVVRHGHIGHSSGQVRELVATIDNLLEE